MLKVPNLLVTGSDQALRRVLGLVVMAKAGWAEGEKALDEGRVVAVSKTATETAMVRSRREDAVAVVMLGRLFLLQVWWYRIGWLLSL